jgi:hypothetical protein
VRDCTPVNMRKAFRGLAATGIMTSTTACSDDDKPAGQASDEGAVTLDADFDARQREYLEVATKTLSPGAPLSVLAHFERATRDRRFTFNPSVVTPGAYRDMFRRIDTFVDTTDFDMLYLTNLWYAYGDKLPPATQAAIAQRFHTFKYWYTEPTPDGIVDNKYYWSENHRIIFHTIEYLAGREFPDDTFTNDGRAGAEHAAAAKERILRWLDEKVRFGFTEWHSNVYYQKDVTPLLTLVEFAPDREVANRAAMVLDLVLLDVAVHLQKGTFGATHGRSYMKDKSTAIDEDTFAFAKLLFDDTTMPYGEGADAGATLFARAKTYVLPPVIRTIAKYDEPIVDKEHMNVPLDAAAPVTKNPTPPFGIAYDNPENVAFWWERGAHTAWQTVELTVRALDEHDLWDSQFYRAFKPLRDAIGTNYDAARQLAQQLHPVLGFGLLSEVHTYTYRARDVMLSTAQDYRPGVFGEQYHAWQATLDERALVFTTHPKEEPEQDTQWPDSDGYWTGTGSMPRSGQHGTVSINIYAPTFEPMGPPFDSFSYVDYTHAYFPQEHFDEIERLDNWTFGRKGDGYVALWSKHKPQWRIYGAGVFTHGLTQAFDLVARGGADNIWIAEVGDAAKWKTFGAFRDAIIAAAKPKAGADNTVEYTSPTEGTMTFGFHAPLTVDGHLVELHEDARIENPFVTVPFQSRRYEVKTGDASLTLDFDSWTRTIAGG